MYSFCPAAIFSSCFNGASAALIAGDFIMPEMPTTTAHTFATSHQSSFSFGRTATLQPMTDPRAVIAATPTKSGGHCMRPEISDTHGPMVAGRNFSLNGATGGRLFGNGLGLGHSLAPAAAPDFE